MAPSPLSRALYSCMGAWKIAGILLLHTNKMALHRISLRADITDWT